MTEKEQFPYRYATAEEITKLYESVEGLIVNMANRVFVMSQGNLEFEDLLSEGNIIFMKTLHNYDVTRGAKFSTILSTCLRNGLYDHLKVQSRRYNREIVFPMENSDEEDKQFETAIQAVSSRQHGCRSEADKLDDDIVKEKFFALIDDIANECFNDEEKMVYRLYFRSDIKRKIEEVAAMMGIKKYKVSEIKNNVVRILQNHLLEYDIEQLKEYYLDGVFSNIK